jgi:hypothetical protein
VREAEGSVEQALRGHAALRASVVWRTEQQHFIRQNLSQPFDAFGIPVRIPDPGPDGALGTSDDGMPIEGRELVPSVVGIPAVNVVRNVPNADSEYWTIDFAASRRSAGRWSMTAGFTHTWNRDQAADYGGQSVRQNAYPLTPNDLIHTSGNGQYRFTTWTAKLFGTFEAPKQVRVAPFLRHQSGQPFGRTVLAALNYGTVRILTEPLGSRRTDNITILDVRVEKGFRVGLGRRAAVFLDVFNLFNTNAEQNISWASGSFRQPLSIVAPRIARLGAKFDW